VLAAYKRIILTINTARAATWSRSVKNAAFKSRGAAARTARIIAIKWVRALPGSLTLSFIHIPPIRKRNIIFNNT